MKSAMLVAIVGVLLAGCSAGFTQQGHSTLESKGLPAITPIRGTGELSPPQDADRFTFVVFGDNRPGRGEAQPDTIKEIFAEIKEVKPAFAISLGDIIEGKPSPDDPRAIEKIRDQFTDFLALASSADTPIFNAPGNHEMDDNEDIPTERMHELYRQCVGPTYGAFTYGNARFIVLNTENVPGPNVPKPPADEEFSYVSPAQIAELKADLDAHRDKKQIFIAMHYPIHAKDQGPPESRYDNRLYPQSRRALVELFSNYTNIAYVLAAHEHVYYNPQTPDDVTAVPGWSPGDSIVYLISGGAGAPLEKNSKWGFYHYLIFTVNGPDVSVELVKLQSTGASS